MIMADDSISRWRPSLTVASGNGDGASGANAMRRHSITVVGTNMQSEFKNLQPSLNTSKPKRRQSIQESLQNITKTMSSSFQKAMHLGGSNVSLHEEGKNRLNKNFFRDVLSAHFKQPDLKVTKISIRHVPNPHTNQIIHEVEVWLKDGRGRRKLDLLAKYHSSYNNQSTPCKSSRSAGSNEEEDDRLSPLTSDRSPHLEEQENSRHNSRTTKTENGWTLDGTNDEMVREYKAYSEVVHDMWTYLRNEKGIAEPDQYLCLPLRYKDTRDKTNNNKLSDLRESFEEKYEEDIGHSDWNGDEILVLQDLFTAGYHSAQQERQDENGLDFNHSIMAISRLARFHAVSFAMKKELQIDMMKKYTFLSEDPVFRPDTKALFNKTQTSLSTRLFSIFQHSSMDLRSFSGYFLDRVKKLHEMQTEYVKATDKFGVICHGDLWRQNVLFFYGSSNMECHTDCLDVRFEDLHRIRYASCVTDLLYFLFTTVDFEVRRDHMMDFLAVYHDHFSKTVSKLAPNVSIFSREELFEEFKSHLMYGFLEGLCLYSAVYESQLKQDVPAGRDESSVRPRYADYKDAITAMISDVIRLKLQGESSAKQL